MESNAYNYVLSEEQLRYWNHESKAVRRWFRAETRLTAKQMAQRAGKTNWLIFAPHEANLESGYI
jgi:hypothetical protein